MRGHEDFCHELHALAERNDEAGDALNDLLRLAVSQYGMTIPPQYYNQLEKWSNEQKGRAQALDHLACIGTEQQVRDRVYAERKRLGLTQRSTSYGAGY